MNPKTISLFVAVVAVSLLFAGCVTDNHGSAMDRLPNQDLPRSRSVDPLYESCKRPWLHPEYSCPGVGG